MSTQTTTPIPEPPATRRLTRSSTDRVIAGVGGGLGRYIGVDPVVVRLALVVLVFFGGVGVFAYIAAWLIVPSDDGNADGLDAAGYARRLGVGLGILVLTAVAAVAGFWGFASGGGTATAIVVIAVGVVLAVGAFTGGMRWLILPAIALALSAGAVAAANLDIRGGAGERIYHPVSGQSLRSSYRLGVGHLLLDLRGTKLGPGDHHVHVKLGVGQAEVIVPPGLCVSSSAHVAVGATTIFERDTGGIDHDWQDAQTAPAARPRLIIDGDIGIGQLRIEPGRDQVIGTNGACRNG